MPELPEVEARCMIMEKAFTGKKIVSFDIYRKGIIKGSDLKIQRGLIDKTLERIDRKGKYLTFEISGGLNFTLHFGLFGDILIVDANDTPQSVCARLGFDNHKALFILKWASLWFGDSVNELKKLGPDPLAAPEKFTVEYLTNTLSDKRTNIKSFLTDQRIIAGIGAVYADEILFKSGILPARITKTINRKEALILREMTIKVLNDATKKIIATGKEDRSFLSLENRENCPVCETAIIKTRMSGRRVLYCPSCQH